MTRDSCEDGWWSRAVGNSKQQQQQLTSSNAVAEGANKHERQYGRSSSSKAADARIQQQRQ